MRKSRFIFLSGLILIAALVRLFPHPPNFTPIASIALFGGAYFTGKKWAFAVPMLAMLASDLLLGLHSTMIFVYGAFALTILIGFMLRDRVNVATVAGASVGSSVIFFLVTNFGVWISGTMYPHTISGLAACYTAAIPFFRSTLVSGLLFSGVLFGIYEYAKRKVPSLQPADS